MLLIVGLSTKSDVFPVEALAQVDAAFAQVGFRKEVRSVVRLGREFSATYDGPSIENAQAERILKPVAEKNGLTFTIEIEESVKFP